MAIADYLNDSEFVELVMNEDTVAADNATIRRIMSTKTNGIEGLPYQFPASVDRRLTGTNVGRKYAEKIFSRQPLLFLTPCEPKFMADFNNNDVNIGIRSLIDLASGRSGDGVNFIEGTGRYYTTEFAYTDYYGYLNTMLSCVAAYMKIFNVPITINGTYYDQLGKVQWQNELNDSFKTFWSSGENLIFYLDSFDSISESFSNDTTESSLASQVNQFSDQINEIRFLFGSDSGLSSVMEGTGTSVSSISQAITGGLGKLGIGSGIVGSLGNKGVNTVTQGGKIIFPEIWANSDYSKSFNLEIKLRSPDNDPLSIFLNIIKPYCKLLALTIPRPIVVDGNQELNSYSAPFLVKAYSKGKFNIDMGIITGLNINKGGTGQWNDDGLPTQIDISVEIKDLYPKFAMSKVGTITSWNSVKQVVNNTAYMDFLATMSGLNVGQMEMGRRTRMAVQLYKASGARLVAGIGTLFDQSVSRLEGLLYGIT